MDRVHGTSPPKEEMSEKKLIRVAREEIEAWKGLPRGLAFAILWAFVYRLTKGRTVDEDFFSDEKEPTSLDCSCL
jgi:hypothetical protein